MDHYFFGWYEGAIWGNILASVVWIVPGYIWGHRHVKRMQRRIDTLHAKSDLRHRQIMHQLQKK